jgi:hypothetical protein
MFCGERVFDEMPAGKGWVKKPFREELKKS